MALKINKSVSQAPFFPPGIAQHKVVSTMITPKPLSSKRPQTVKECKMLSKTKSTGKSSSLKDPNGISEGLRRFSNSTPNLKVCHFPNQSSSIHKHNCDMGIVDPGSFRASPMPSYYAFESLERNRSMLDSFNERDKTRSLDRLSSSKKFKSLTGFIPEKPFYPPSKYPNMHDKKDGNIQRLIETRDKYKTPESRKSAHKVARRQSTSCLDRKNNKTSKPPFGNGNLKKSPNYGSVPNMNKKNKNVKSNMLDPDRDAFNDFYGDQMAYTSEIGPYRQSNRLDLQASDETDRPFGSDMYTSYFYPKPIPNQKVFNSNDRMAQSLICERSLASLILTGSLDRANRNGQYRQRENIPDIDDSPSKSKLLNSFSQDSLDGRRSQKRHTDGELKDVVDGGKSPGISCDEMSLNSELDKSTTMSQLEDDEVKTLCSNNSELRGSSKPHYLMNTDWEKSSLGGHVDQYNLDQHTNATVNINDLSSFVCSVESNPLSVRNEFITNREHSIIGKDDQRLISDLASKCIVSTDQHYDRMLNKHTDDQTLISDQASKCIDSTDQDYDRMFPKHTDEPMEHLILRDPNHIEDAILNADHTLINNLDSKRISNKSGAYDRIFVTTNNDLTGITDLPAEDYRHFNYPSYVDPIDDNEEPFKRHSHRIITSGSSLKRNDIFDVPKNEVDSIDKGSRILFIDKAPTIAMNTDQTNGQILFQVENRFCDKEPDVIFSDGHFETNAVDPHRAMNESYTLKKDHYGDERNPDESFPNNAQSRDENFDSNFFSSLNIHFNGPGDPETLKELPNHTTYDPAGRHTLNPHNPELGDEDYSESTSTNELSWSGYDENNYADYSVPNQRSGIPWVSSPELHSAQCSLMRRPNRHLQSENPLKPLCSFCHKPAYFMERISISNIIFHKSCFRCHKCFTHLNFNNCIIHRNRAYCLVHVRPKIWKSVRSASANKLHQIKARLDDRANLQRQTSTETKQQKRIFYDGINSAKNKFFEDATKSRDPQLKDHKRITPPRQGFNSGVIESEPKPRDPNIVASRDSQTGYFDDIAMLAKSGSAKETRARFKELQAKSNGTKETSNGNVEESILTRRSDFVTVYTKSLRDRFLAGANDSNTKLTKINPSDDIQRLTKPEVNSIYENDPELRTDVVRSDNHRDNEVVTSISRSKAKELKERFTNFGQNEVPKKSEFKLDYGEGGVYESNPQENHEDVVKHNYDNTVDLPENTVKSGLQRIKDLQDIKSQSYQRTNKDPIKLETDPSLSGIYENTPEQSRADSIAGQQGASLIEFREKSYTNDAKRVLLEKQKEEEEASLKRSTPHMIDIWKDLCPDSGVFENQPKEQLKHVVKYEYNADELTTQSEDTELSDRNPHIKGDVEGHVQESN